MKNPKRLVTHILKCKILPGYQQQSPKEILLLVLISLLKYVDTYAEISLSFPYPYLQI